MAAWDDIVSAGAPVTIEPRPEAMPGGVGSDMNEDPNAAIPPAPLPPARRQPAAAVTSSPTPAPAPTPASVVTTPATSVAVEKPSAWAAIENVGEVVKPVATVTPAEAAQLKGELKNDTRTEVYLGQSKAGGGDALKLGYEAETGRETANGWTAFGNQSLGIIGLGTATAVRQDRVTSDILGDKYPRAVADPNTPTTFGTPGGQNLKIATYKLSEQPIDTIAESARSAGIAPAKIAKARRDAGDDQQVFFESVRQLAAGEVAKRDAVKIRASTALKERGTTTGGYITKAVVPQIPYTAGFMVYGAGGPVGLTALIAKTSLEAADKFATDQYEVDDNGRILKTRTGDEAGAAIQMGAARGAVSVGVEVAGGKLLNYGLKLGVKPFMKDAAAEALDQLGIVKYATRNWKPGITRNVVQNAVNVADAAHFSGTPGEYFEELLDPVASSLLGVSDSYSDRTKVEAFKAEMGQFWSGKAQGELVVGLLGLQALGALTGLPLTMRDSVRDKSVKQATHSFLMDAGVSKADADEIVAKDEWMRTLQGISNLPEDKARTILAGLSDKSASIVAQVNNSFAAKRDAKNYTPDFAPEDLAGAVDVDGDHQLGTHLHIFNDQNKVTLSDLNSGLTLGEYDVSTPEGLSTLAKEATEASQFNQALTEQRNQKAKYIKDVVTRLGVGTDVFFGATRKDVAAELRSIGKTGDADMFESGQTYAMSLGGTTFIALDAVQSPQAAVETVLHETGVHDAITSAFKNVKGEHKTEIIDAVIGAIGRKPAMRLAEGELTRRFFAEARLTPEGEARTAAMAKIPERAKAALSGGNDTALWVAMEEVLASVAGKGVHKTPAKRSKLENAVMNTFFKDEAVNERIRNFVANKQEMSKGDVRFYGYGNIYDADGNLEPDETDDTPPPDDDSGDGGTPAPAPAAPTPAAPAPTAPAKPVEQPVESPAPTPVVETPTPPPAPATPLGGDKPATPAPAPAPTGDGLTDAEKQEIKTRFDYSDEEIAKLDPAVARTDLEQARAQEAGATRNITKKPAEPPAPAPETNEDRLVGHEKLLAAHLAANPQIAGTIRIAESPRDEGVNRIEGLTVTGENKKLTAESRKIDNYVTRLGRKYGVSVERDGNRVWVDVPKRIRHSGQWIASNVASIAPSTRVSVSIKGDGAATVTENELQKSMGHNRTRIFDFLSTMDGESDGQSSYRFPILTAIEAGELSVAPESEGTTKANYDGIRDTPLPPALAKKLFKEGARTKVDEMAKEQRGNGVLKTDDVGEFWSALLGEVDKYDNWVREGAKSADELVAERDQAEQVASEESADAEAAAKVVTPIVVADSNTWQEMTRKYGPPNKRVDGSFRFINDDTGETVAVADKSYAVAKSPFEPSDAPYKVGKPVQYKATDGEWHTGVVSGYNEANGNIAISDSTDPTTFVVAKAEISERVRTPAPVTPPTPPTPPDTRTTTKQKAIDRMRANVEAANKPKAPVAPALNLDGGTPEDIVADQKKRAAQQKKQAERDDLAKRANKPLTGDMGDNTLPLPLDLEKPLDSDIPLFTQPPSAPDENAVRKAKLKAFLAGGRSGVFPTDDEIASGRFKLVTEPEEIKYLHFRSGLRKFFLDNWDEYYDGAADLLVDLSADGGEDAERLIRFATDEFDDDMHPTFTAVIADSELQGDENDWMRAMDLDIAEATKYFDEKASAEYTDEARIMAEQQVIDEAKKREAAKAKIESGTSVTRREQGKANVTDPRLRVGMKFLHGEKMLLDDGTEFTMPDNTQIVVTNEDGVDALVPFDGFGEGMIPTVWVVSINTQPSNSDNIVVYGWGATEDDAAQMSRERMRVSNALIAGAKKAELLFPPRVGAVDPLNGEPGTQDVIKAEFGLADIVNFGVSIPKSGAESERQTWVTGLYQGLHDLATILNIPHAAIGFGGGFHLAVGVTGKGSANAHYIPDTGVVGLTRKNGAGALAHEWWHHLQDWMKKTLGMGNDTMFPKSADLMFPDNRSTPTSIAYQNLFVAMHTTSNLTTDTEAYDKAEAMKPAVRTQMLADGYTEGEVLSAFKGDSVPQKNTPGTAMFRAYAAYANYNAADGTTSLTAFNLASKDADHGKAKYWMTSHEKMARILQHLTALSLAQRGIVNSVLTDYTFPSESGARDLSSAGVVALSKQFDEFTAALSAMWTAELPKFDAKPVTINFGASKPITGVTTPTASGGRKVIKPQYNTAVEKDAKRLLTEAAGFSKATEKSKERDRKYAASLKADGEIGRYKLQDAEIETRRDLWRKVEDVGLPGKVRINRFLQMVVETTRTKYQLARLLDGTGMEAYAYDIERLLKERSAYYIDDGLFGPMFDRLRAATMKEDVTKQMLADGYTATEVQSAFSGTFEPQKTTPGTAMFRKYLTKVASESENTELYEGIDGTITVHTEKVPPALRDPLTEAQANWKTNHPGLTAKAYLTAKLGMTEEELTDALKLGQQDTATLALSAFDAGRKAFLVAHQAGFGKGRTLTAIMRGLPKGRILFFTEKSTLWADLGRDAAALGVTQKMYATDQEAENITFIDAVLQPDGSSEDVVRFSAPAHGEISTKLPAKQNNRLIADAPHGDSIVVTSYDQLKDEAKKYFAAVDAKKQPPTPEQNKFAAVIAYVQKGDCTIIADESHNAVGEGTLTNRMLSHLVDLAPFTVFSSGTAATSLDSLMFYTPYLQGAQLYPEQGVFQSALRGLGIDMVGEVVRGIVGHGSMVRFVGYTPDVQMFDPLVDPETGEKRDALTDEEIAENNRSLAVADGLNGAAHAISAAQRIVGAAFEITPADRKRRTKDNREGNAPGVVFGLSAAMTSNSAYNNVEGLAKGITEQGWLASKIDQIVRQVVKDVDNGIAPSLALFNTNNSLLENLEAGDAVSAVGVLRTKIKAGLEKMFVITRGANQEGNMSRDTEGDVTYDLRKWEDIAALNRRFGDQYVGIQTLKNGDMNPKYTKLLPPSTADDMRNAFEQATEAIDGYLTQLETANFTMSPIDTLREKISANNILVVEATARPFRVVDGKKVAYADTETYKGRKVRRVTAAFAQYNAKADGRVVMIYNPAANAGVSGHLTLQTPNQFRRRTYFLQIPPNPAEYEQMIFRWSRTNMVTEINGRNMLPQVFFFPSSIPAEKRMMENNKKKVAALSAVTSGSKSARLAVGDENMVNEYGDRAAQQIALGPYGNALRDYGFDTSATIGRVSGEYLMEFLLRIQAMPTSMQTDILQELDSTVYNIVTKAIEDGVYHGEVEAVRADNVVPSFVTDRGYMVAMITTMASRTLEYIVTKARNEWMANRAAATAALNEDMAAVVDKNTSRPLPRVVYSILEKMASKLNLTGNANDGNMLVYGGNTILVTDFRREGRGKPGEGKSVLSLDGYVIHAYAQNGRKLAIRLSRLYSFQKDSEGAVDDYNEDIRVAQATTPFVNRWGDEFADLSYDNKKRRMTNLGRTLMKDARNKADAETREHYVSDSKHYIVGKTIRDLGRGLGELIVPNRQLAIVEIDVGGAVLYGVQVNAHTDILPQGTATDFVRELLTSDDSFAHVTPMGMSYEIDTTGKQLITNRTANNSGDKDSAERFGKRIKETAGEAGLKGAAPILDYVNAALGGKLSYVTRKEADPARVRSGETISDEDLSSQFAKSTPAPDVEEYTLAQNPTIGMLTMGEVTSLGNNYGVFTGGEWVVKTADELGAALSANINMPFVTFEPTWANARFYRIGNDKGEMQQVTRGYAEQLDSGEGAIVDTGAISVYDHATIVDALSRMTSAYGMKAFNAITLKNTATMFLAGTDSSLFGTKKGKVWKVFERYGGMYGVAVNGRGGTGYYATASGFKPITNTMIPRVIAANLLQLRNRMGDEASLSDIIAPMGSQVDSGVKQDVVYLLSMALKDASTAKRVEGAKVATTGDTTFSAPVLVGSNEVFPVRKTAGTSDYWEVLGAQLLGVRTYLTPHTRTNGLPGVKVPTKAEDYVYSGQIAILRTAGDKSTILDRAMIGTTPEGFALSDDLSLGEIEAHNAAIRDSATNLDTSRFKLEDLSPRDQQLLDAVTKGLEHYDNAGLAYGNEDEAIVEGVVGGFRDATNAQRAAMGQEPYEVANREGHTHTALAEQAIAILQNDPARADTIAARVASNQDGPGALMTDLDRVILTIGRQIVNRKARAASLRASAAAASPASAQSAMEALLALVERDNVLRLAQDLGGTAAGRALNAIKASFTPSLDLTYRIGAAQKTLGRTLTPAEIAAIHAEIDTLKSQKAELEATIGLLRKQQDGKTGKPTPPPKPEPRVTTLVVRSKVAAHHNANPTMSPDEIFAKVAVELGVPVSSIARAFTAVGRFSLNDKPAGNSGVRDSMSDWWKQAEARAAELSKEPELIPASPSDDSEPPEGGNIALEAVKLAVNELGPDASRDAVINRAMDYVKDTSLADLTVNEFERAVIRYDQHPEDDARTPEQVRVSELKTELLWHQRYFDILNGTIPEKRGKPATPQTQEAREWHRKFAEIMKNADIPDEEKARLLASANVRIQRTLENRIADLTKAIAANELIPASERTSPVYNDENVVLKSEKDRLEALYKELPAVMDAMEARRMKRAEDQLAYWKTRRADAENGIFKGKKPEQPVSDRLREIRDRIVAVQDEVQRLKAEDPVQVAARVAEYVGRVYEEIAAIDSRIATGAAVREEATPQSAYQIASVKEREALRLARIRERDAWRRQNADLWESEREQTRIATLTAQIDAAEARIAASDYVRDTVRAKRPFNKEIYEKERKLKELNERIQFESDKLANPTVFYAKALNAVYRFVRQSMDFSVIGLQAADTLRTDLVFNGGAGARNILTEAWLGTKDPAQVGRIVHELLSDPEVLEAVHLGLDVTKLFDELTGGSLAGYMVSRAPAAIHIATSAIEASQRHFLVTSLLARVQEYKQLLRSAPEGHDWSELEKRLFVSVANTTTGVGDVRILGLGSRAVGNGIGKILWAARLTASQVQRAFLLNGIIGFGAERGILFRNDVSGEFKRAVVAQNLKHLASFVALNVALKVLLGAIGWSLPDDDPNAEGWFDFLFDPPNIGGIEIDLSGRVTTMRRSVFKLVGADSNKFSARSGNLAGRAQSGFDTLNRMTSGRLSPDLAFMWSTILGQTAFGDPFGPFAGEGNRVEGMMNMGKSMTPLSVEQMTQVDTSRGALATAAMIGFTITGMTAGATSTSDYRMNLHSSRMSLYNKESDPARRSDNWIDKQAEMRDKWGVDISRDAGVKNLISQAHRAKKAGDTARYEALAGVVEGMLSQ